MNKETVTLGPIDVKWIKDNGNDKSFGDSDILTVDTYDYNKKISRSLLLNNNTIGYILLKKASMILVIKYICYYIKKGTYSNLKMFVPNDYLKKYINRRGTYITRIYIDPKHRGNKYANILVEYARGLGDYNWGTILQGLTNEYWISKHGHIKILTYSDSDGKTDLTITADKI